MKTWFGMLTLFGWAILVPASSPAGKDCRGAGKKAECEKPVACVAEQKVACAEKKEACEPGKKAECGAEKSVDAAVPAVKEKTGKPQTQCPIMTAPINKKLFVDHAGKRIYVCCNECVAAVQRDPAATITKLEAQGIDLEKVKAK